MKFILAKKNKNIMFEVYPCGQISINSYRYLFTEFRRILLYKFTKITFYISNNFLILLVRIEFFILQVKMKIFDENKNITSPKN